MKKYDFSFMPDCNLATIFHCVSQMLPVLSSHYQAQVFNKDADIFYVGELIDKLREVVKEASEEMDSRQAKHTVRTDDIKEAFNGFNF